MKRTLLSLCLLSCSAVLPAWAAAPEKLELNPGDHVAIVGGGFADRLQNDGFLETLIYQRYPKAELVIRNLGFAGDEVARRDRSENFGTPEDWLQRVKASVVLACFGYNEAFAGPAALPKFKEDLDKYLKSIKAGNFSGQGAPRVVLISPVAQEKNAASAGADAAATNANLRLYTEAMGQVAQANDVQFVDLFTVTQELYSRVAQPLTTNGFHLTAEGNKTLAPMIFQALFGEAPATGDQTASAKLRAAIMDRNAMWQSRYRTVDGYNVYGGRSALAYQPGKGGFVSNREAPAPYVSNFKIMQEEMAVRDVMTANRDQRVWSVAQGGDAPVDDRNMPPVEPVPTNHPGDKPNGLHTFLSGEDAIAKMKLPAGLKVNLFASEEQFPELIKPVQMAWDAKGRLWVSSWRAYPERTPWDPVGDSILILEDTNADGKADKCSTFVSNLNCPTGFQFYKDGILLVQAPNLWFVRDVNGDGKADSMERVLMGLDSADSHHQTNAMALDPTGAVYLSDGVFHRTQVETPNGVVRNSDAAIYRYEPTTNKFETYVSYGFANPHGKVFDRWGNDIITDATGNANYFAPAFSGRLDYPAKHPKMKEFWTRPSRPCAGTNILSSRHFPEAFQNNFLNCNVISLQAIFRVNVKEEGSGLTGESLEHLVISEDPNFRPAYVNVGPEGAVYFADWSNSIIGHMQHHLRDPNRDQIHGRIYRITAEGRDLLPRPKIAGEPIEKLLDLLKLPENDVRTLAKLELGNRNSTDVVAAAKKWATALDKSDPEFEHHRLEALWVQRWHQVLDTDLLQQVMASPEPRARAAAARVLCYAREMVPNALELFQKVAADESPRVRLEAVRAASFYTGDQAKPAASVVYQALGKETDYYLDYCATETLKQLAAQSKEPLLPQEPKALTWVLDHMDNSQLAKAPSIEPVLVTRLARRGLDLPTRDSAATELAKLRGTTKQAEIIAALQRLDAQGDTTGGPVGDLGKVLVLSTPAELQATKPKLTELANAAKQPAVRRTAYAGLLAAEPQPTSAWASANPERRQYMADALALVADPAARAQFQPLLAAVLKEPGTPAALRDAALRALPLMGPANAAENFKTLAGYVQSDESARSLAARALMQLPRDSWNKEAAEPLVQSVITWAKTVPAAQRTTQQFVETMQAGMELSTLLPAPQGAELRQQMRSLGVSVFVVKTVHEQMRYDTTRLVVEPGKPFEVIFENADQMPHNIVFVKPGQREAIGMLANTMTPVGMDKQGRVYVPNNPAVIGASKLLEAGQKETLKLQAPKEQGEYEYVCTFPGHWPVMFGKLIVTKDPEKAMQAVAPATAQAAAPHVHQH